jgi:hypothetical protein
LTPCAVEERRRSREATIAKEITAEARRISVKKEILRALRVSAVILSSSKKFLAG